MFYISSCILIENFVQNYSCACKLHSACDLINFIVLWNIFVSIDVRIEPVFTSDKHFVRSDKNDFTRWVNLNIGKRGRDYKSFVPGIRNKPPAWYGFVSTFIISSTAYLYFLNFCLFYAQYRVITRDIHELEFDRMIAWCRIFFNKITTLLK